MKTPQERNRIDELTAFARLMKDMDPEVINAATRAERHRHRGVDRTAGRPREVPLMPGGSHYAKVNGWSTNPKDVWIRSQGQGP